MLKIWVHCNQGCLHWS